MTDFSMVRISHDEIKRIIEDHLAAKYGGTAQVTMIWPDRDRYGNQMFANVAIRSPEALPHGYYSPQDEARPVRELSSSVGKSGT